MTEFYPLYTSTISGNFEEVKILMSVLSNQVYEYDRCHNTRVKDTILCYAAYEGHIDIVKYIINMGADPHTRFSYPLVYTARNGFIDIVKYLVDIGVDPTDGDNKAIVYALENGKYDVVKYLKSITT